MSDRLIVTYPKSTYNFDEIDSSIIFIFVIGIWISLRLLHGDINQVNISIYCSLFLVPHTLQSFQR